MKTVRVKSGNHFRDYKFETKNEALQCVRENLAHKGSICKIGHMYIIDGKDGRQR